MLLHEAASCGALRQGMCCGAAPQALATCLLHQAEDDQKANMLDKSTFPNQSKSVLLAQDAPGCAGVGCPPPT